KAVSQLGALDRARHREPADAYRRDGEGAPPIRASATSEALLEQVDHGLEDRLVRSLHDGLASRDVARKGNQWAASVDVLEVLAGEVPADALPGRTDGAEVDADALPPARRWLGQGQGHRLGIEIALGPEVAVEAAASQSGVPHDVVDGSAVEPVAIEQK